MTAAGSPGHGGAQHPRIAVIGATGFIGSATLRALTTQGATVTAIARRPAPQPRPAGSWISADVTDVHALTAALENIDVVIHAGSYTGSDPRLCDAVNRRGTENVLLAADRSGVESVVTVSTIGVYGPGPFTDLVEDTYDENPVTAVSASRAAADHNVRAHGGTVVRPGFVHGPGDRWFVPGLWHIVNQLGSWIDHGAAMLSTIDVRILANQLAALALNSTDGDRGMLFHASEPDPPSVRTIATATSDRDRPLPPTNLTYRAALRHAPHCGLTPRQIDLCGRSHTLDGTRLRSRLTDRFRMNSAWETAYRASSGHSPDGAC